MIKPSGGERFLYYTLGVTPSAVSREWVERDVHTTGWQVRRALQIWVGMILGGLIAVLLAGAMSPDRWGVPAGATLIGAAIGGFIAGSLHATLMANYLRRRTLSYYEKRWERQLPQ